MPSLPQLPLSHLAPLRRLPFWAHALALCALFAIAAAAILDDYGATGDEATQRDIAQANADYIATGATDGLYKHDYRYYGVAFEMPLLLAERALGLQGWRQIYLTRHLLTHLLFIAGGFAFGMLAYRMLGSRWIALLATLMFMLHPRLYAQSFFNSKDIPFAAMLIVALCLAHRAFRRDAIGAFLLCGIGVGIAINLRPFGLMLPPLILAMRAPDLWRARKTERKRILLASAAFLAAALATAYIVHPYYWENPLRFIEGVSFLSRHPYITQNLFMGEIYLSDAVPWNYIPVWFAITAPPIALLLGAIGCAAICSHAITRPLAALRDREIRFRVLLFSCIALPVAIVIILQSPLHHGWRHMYFLWGPFCLLAAVGLHTITNIRMGGGIWKVGARQLRRFRGGGNRLRIAQRTLAYGIAGFGLITTLTAIAALHPHQQVYFNALVDTNTPGALAKRYEMDYWLAAQRQAAEYLLARYPDDTLRVYMRNHNARILPQNDRTRIAFSPPLEADFYVISPPNISDIIEGPALHSLNAYGNAIWVIYAPNSHEHRNANRAAYNDAETNGTLLARADFDIYAHNGALYYLNANCAPPRTNVIDGIARIFLHIFPANPADLPAEFRERGFENRNFYPHARLALFDGKCIYKQSLPAYPIARISTGERADGGIIWRVNIDLPARAAAQAVYESVAAGDYGLSAAQSDFNVYIRDGGLAYIKENCAESDTAARFFLHIFPSDPANLPAANRKRGIANLDFQFTEHGAYIGDKCVAARELPAYPIARIRTGQLMNDAAIWRADINPAAHAAAQAVYERIAAGDYGQSIAQSHFDLYLTDNALAYIKEPCAPGDTNARFFLHITPADPAALPADGRERGFANMDFRFSDYGAHAGDICAATRDLPDYAIERIRTGQKAVALGGDGWRADIDLAALAAAQALYESIAAGDYGNPIAQSHFDLYLTNNALTYLKAPCAEGDTHARFFLHIIPADPADLPAPNRERGFANLDFHFADHGAHAANICAATINLPDYPIDRIHTGQFISGERSLWRIEFAAER